MKVSIALKGRFHAFHLARQLHAAQHLERLITSMPGFVAAAAGIPRRLVRSLVGHEVAARVAARLPRALRPGADFDRALHDSVARAIARRLPRGADAHVIWSGVALPSLRRVAGSGAISILERGSSHILDQRERLLHAFACAGHAGSCVPDHAVERELEEYALADFISVPSTFVRRTFLERGFAAERILTVPYGVDLQRFQPRAEGDEPPCFRVLFCGAASVQKGSHHLLQAFAQLALPRAELWFAGPCLPELGRAVRDHASPAVHFLGAQRRDEIPACYRAASVFCIPSIQDGFPLAHLEALASGLPVIASRSSGCVDVIEDGVNGFLIDAGDVDALKDRLQRLHDDAHLRRAMARAARRTAEGYSWEVYGTRIAQAYRAARAIGARDTR